MDRVLRSRFTAALAFDPGPGLQLRQRSQRGLDLPALDPFACDVFDNLADFRDAAGSWIRYGFEINDLSEDLSDLPVSPVDAANFDDHFDIGYANLDMFNVEVNPGGACTTGPERSLYTWSVLSASSYSLTFSNFEGDNSFVTAFGLIVCDFASYMSTATSIKWDTAAHSGTLLKVPSEQVPDTKNFIGIVCLPEAEFNSITLTFDDNASGRQQFDNVQYVPRSDCAPGRDGFRRSQVSGFVSQKRATRTVRGGCTTVDPVDVSI